MITAPAGDLSDESADTGAVLGSKLTIPEPGDAFVVRPRLEAVLDDGVRRGVVLVSAPPGSGKTELLAAWAQKRPQAVAWLSLDAADASVPRFLGYVVAAIARIAPEPARTQLQRLEPLPPLVEADEHYLALVTSALQALDRRLVLVLDEFHNVAGTPTERMVAQLLRHRPRSLSVVIVGRIDPAVDAHRLRVAGQLVEVRAADLAFSADEARTMLEAGGVLLADPDVARLVEVTEGWAAGLRLATVSLEQAPDAHEFLEEFGGEDRYVADYLLGEVLARQPEDVRRFLLDTCVVDRVSGDLANVLTGRHDGASRLAALVRANVFLVAIDSRRTWFRWHPMFAELMRSRLRVEDPTREAELHRAAARWLAENALPVDAARHAAAVGDWPTVTRLLGESWLDLVLQGEPATVEALARLVPEDVAAEDADMALVAAVIALTHGDAVSAGQLAARAGLLARRLPPERQLTVESRAVMVRLHLATLAGQDSSGQLVASAGRLLGELRSPFVAANRANRVTRGLLSYALGAFETCVLDFDAAAPHLRAALPDAAATRMWHISLATYAQFVSHDFRTGRFERARQRALEIIDMAGSMGWAGYHNLATAYDNLAGIAILRDELQTAMQHLANADDVVLANDLVDRFHITFLRGVALRGLGRVAAARDSLARLESLVAQWEHPDWATMSLTTAQADQLAAEGCTTEALALLESLDPESPGASITRPHGVLRAALLVDLGRPAEARAVLRRWTVPERGRPVRVAALVVDALAAESSGRHAQAVDIVAEALADAYEERLLRPFVEHRAVGSLVEDCVDVGTPHEAFALQVLKHTADEGRPPASGGYFVEPLSERELEVLRFLQGTLSNAEIADRLFLSINTIKTHVKNINRKLGTTGRRDAVRRARELGLL